jgi:hypothetical protein
LVGIRISNFYPLQTEFGLQKKRRYFFLGSRDLVPFRPGARLGCPWWDARAGTHGAEFYGWELAAFARPAP